MALPPRYQNLKDLKVMYQFIEDHPVVAGQLKSIDVKKKIIYFSDNCEARFGRVSVKRKPGWVGPAAPLSFEQCNCDID